MPGRATGLQIDLVSLEWKCGAPESTGLTGTEEIVTGPKKKNVLNVILAVADSNYVETLKTNIWAFANA